MRPEDNPPEFEAMSEKPHEIDKVVIDPVEGPQVYDTFTLFPKLPIELRLKIYSYTKNFSSPALWLTVAPLRDSYGCYAPPLTILNGRRHLEHSTSITAMAICSESREEALRKNSNWSSMNVEVECVDEDTFPFIENYEQNSLSVGKPVYVDPAKDIFLFQRWNRENNSFATLDYYGIKNTASKISSVTHTATAFSKVEHIAICFPLLFRASTDQQNNFLAYLSNFSVLKDLTLVFSMVHDHLCSTTKIHYFGNVQTAICSEAAGFLQRYVERLFYNQTGHDPKSKRPAIKVVYHSIDNIYGNSSKDERTEGRQIDYESKLNGTIGWENEMKDILQELKDTEASLHLRNRNLGA